MIKFELYVQENKEKELVEFFEKILRSLIDKTKFIVIEYWHEKNILRSI